MPATFYTDISLVDYTKEKSSFRVYYGEVTAASLPGLQTELTTLKAATNALCHNAVAGFTDVLQHEVTNPVPVPTDKNAQRESKLLVTYRPTDNSVPNKLYRLQIPCVDVDLLTFTGTDAQGRDRVDFTSAGAVKTWLDAFRALGKIPDYPGANGGFVIDGVYFVAGR